MKKILGWLFEKTKTDFSESVHFADKQRRTRYPFDPLSEPIYNDTAKIKEKICT